METIERIQDLRDFLQAQFSKMRNGDNYSVHLLDSHALRVDCYLTCAAQPSIYVSVLQGGHSDFAGRRVVFGADKQARISEFWPWVRTQERRRSRIVRSK